MTTVTHCLECGAELNASEASGLCPRCMLKLGLASQLASGTLPVSARGLREDGSIVEPFDFGHYRILRLLGKGGMGSVYEAEDQETQRRVALKVLGHFLDTAEMRARFLREGQIAASISHPNVVGIFQAHEIENTPVIAMELVHDGTLRDRVRRKGPLPVAEAVDFTLQIIDGLEAAQRTGVLHRDVKPANCFVTPEGLVKVGDFGLSISTLARAEADLTAHGTILGTPAFAAPEQLRGREVDVRADIYAVGATLYYLLTGKPTHEADTLVSLIAAVLEQVPPEPRQLRQDLPRALSKLVMRCLAKEPSSRVQAYDELRTALLPFSSKAVTPATLGLRLLAGIVDGAVAALPATVFLGMYGVLPEENAVLEQTFESVLVLAAFWIVQVSYYAIPEGLWGASFGKALCGLRVVRTDQENELGMWRPVVRAVVFCVPTIIEALIAASIPLQPVLETRLEEVGISRTVFITGALFLVLFATMRRKNGFAAIHDLLTGTRVVAQPSTQRRPSLDLEQTPIPVVGADQIGPYAVTRRQGKLIEAWDTMLRRPVWICLASPSGEVSTAPRQQISRITRLRWLTGEHSASATWDAYEALDGVPLTALLDKQQPWSRVRFWLLDLAEEIHQAISEGTLTRGIGVQDVWITRSGRAVLLEFSAPDALPGPVTKIGTASDTSVFLSSIADQACNPRMPLHAVEFLDHLRRKHFEDTAIIAANLRALVARPAHFTRQRRLITFAVPLLFALTSAVSIGINAHKTEQDFDFMWAKNHPERPSLRLVLDAYSYSFAKDPSGKQRLVNFVATNYRDVILDSAFWERAETKEAIDPTLRTLATEAVSTKDKYAAEDVPLNDSVIAEILKAHAEFEHWIRFIVMPAFLLIQILFLLTLGSLWTLFGQAPFALHMAGAVLVCADGKPVSRLRGFVRSLPVVLMACGLIVFSLVMMFDWSGVAFVGLLLFVAIALVVGGIMGMKRVEQGLLDRIAGTYIVPR